MGSRVGRDGRTGQKVGGVWQARAGRHAALHRQTPEPTRCGRQYRVRTAMA